MNLLEGVIEDGVVRFGSSTLPLPEQHDLRAYAGRTVALGIRPSDFSDVSLAPDASLPAIDVAVEVTEELGSEVNVLFTLDAPAVDTADTRAIVEDEGADLQIPLMVDAGRAPCTARVDARSRCRPGETMRLAVDTSRLYFFDKETGAAIATPEQAATATPV